VGPPIHRLAALLERLARLRPSLLRARACANSGKPKAPTAQYRRFGAADAVAHINELRASTTELADELTRARAVAEALRKEVSDAKSLAQAQKLAIDALERRCAVARASPTLAELRGERVLGWTHPALRSPDAERACAPPSRCPRADGLLLRGDSYPCIRLNAAAEAEAAFRLQQVDMEKVCAPSRIPMPCRLVLLARGACPRTFSRGHICAGPGYI
jgi:hypothetical protein